MSEHATLQFGTIGAEAEAFQYTATSTRALDSDEATERRYPGFMDRLPTPPA